MFMNLKLELLDLLVRARKVYGTPFITINDEGYYVFTYEEAIKDLTHDVTLRVKYFNCYEMDGTSYYILKVN